MNIKKNILFALEEHTSIANLLDEHQFTKMLELINNSDKLFISAAGRSMLQMKGFAMRLMHIDYKVDIVGEVTTTAIGKNDIIIAASGSGETVGIINQVKKAKDYNAKSIVITQNNTSTISKYADLVIEIPKTSTVLPGGTQFEQFLGICLDAFIMEVMKIKKLSFDYIYKNHANLE